jgi:folate-binding Fe-S cluster repair protein YgfZ
VERTVSFTKGCYTGQELVARLDARGSNVPRRLVGVIAAARLAPGMTLHAGTAPVDAAGEKDFAGEKDVATDKVVGSITSAAWSPEVGSWVALGYLHRTVASPGPVRVRSGDGLGGAEPAQVAPLPLIEP